MCNFVLTIQICLPSRGQNSSLQCCQVVEEKLSICPQGLCHTFCRSSFSPSSNFHLLFFRQDWIHTTDEHIHFMTWSLLRKPIGTDGSGGQQGITISTMWWGGVCRVPSWGEGNRRDKCYKTFLTSRSS